MHFPIFSWHISTNLKVPFLLRRLDVMPFASRCSFVLKTCVYGSRLILGRKPISSHLSCGHMRAIRSSLVCLATALVVQCAQVLEVDEAPGSCSEAETLKARGCRDHGDEPLASTGPGRVWQGMADMDLELILPSGNLT